MLAKCNDSNGFSSSRSSQKRIYRPVFADTAVARAVTLTGRTCNNAQVGSPLTPQIRKLRLREAKYMLQVTQLGWIRQSHMICSWETRTQPRL